MRKLDGMRLLVAAGIVAVGAPVNAQGIQYHWKTDQPYRYKVTLEAEEPAYFDLLTGDVTYVVEGTEPDLVLRPAGTLRPVQFSKEKVNWNGQAPSRLAHLTLGAPSSLRRISVDSLGHLKKTADKSTAPSVFGDLTRLLVVPLSTAGTWTVEDDCAIAIQPAATSAGAQPKLLPGHEKLDFSAGDPAGDATPVNEKYDLATTEKVGQTPRLELSGSEQIVFDGYLGVPRSMDFGGTLATASKTGTEQTPITLKVRLLEKPLSHARGAALTEAQREDFLAKLASPDQNTRHSAELDLQRLGPDDHCSEIADGLVPLLDDPDLFVRWAAVDALKVWADASAIPALHRALEDNEHAVRWAALSALGELQDPRSAGPLAKRLDSPDEGFVADALVKLGPAAEDAVLPYLNDPQWTVRMDVCKVLGKVGSLKSIPYLQARARVDTGIVSGAITDAAKAIYARAQMDANGQG